MNEWWQDRMDAWATERLVRDPDSWVPVVELAGSLSDFLGGREVSAVQTGCRFSMHLGQSSKVGRVSGLRGSYGGKHPTPSFRSTDRVRAMEGWRLK